MAKRNADTASSPPAVWERLLGALLWILQGVIWFWPITTLLALVAGLAFFLTMRKRRPFLARVSGFFLIWWLALNLSYPFIVVAGLLKGMPRNTMEFLLTNNLPTLVNAPGLIPLYWQSYDPQAKAIMALLLGHLVLNLLVCLGGVIVSLFGGRPRWP